jgi:hypothetical protein
MKYEEITVGSVYNHILMGVCKVISKSDGIIVLKDDQGVTVRITSSKEWHQLRPIKAKPTSSNEGVFDQWSRELDKMLALEKCFCNLCNPKVPVTPVQLKQENIQTSGAEKIKFTETDLMSLIIELQQQLIKLKGEIMKNF